MRIQTNIASLQAQGRMQSTLRQLSTAYQRLSSGSRINVAKDDASGLAVANGLQAQRLGVLRGIRNINESQSLISTAEGALQSQLEIIQRMKELAVQAANGTLDSTSRGFLQAELNEIYAEFQRITSTSKFNNQNLLDGSFESQSIIVGSQSSQRLDLSLESTESSRIFQREIGTGQYDELSSQSIDNGSSDLELIDIDGDSHLDIVELNDTTNEIHIRKGDGNGNFDLFYSISVDTLGSSMSLHDMNGDGSLDIVVGNGDSNSVSIFSNNGSGSFSHEATINIAHTIHDVVAGDFNGDGVMDVAASGLNGTGLLGRLSIALGTGQGNYDSATVTGGATTVSRSIQAYDFNGDGRDDIVGVVGNVTPPAVRVLTSNGSGGFSANSLVVAETGIEYGLMDLNSDGLLDIITTSDSNLRYYENTGAGFNGSIIGTGRASVTDFKFGDINLDGRLDFILTGLASSHVYFQTESESFEYGNQIDASYYMGLGDVDGDEIVDIVSALNGDLDIYKGKSRLISATDRISVQTQESAEDLIKILSQAQDNVVSRLSNLGAISSRLRSASSSAGVLNENLATSESQIRDADLAEVTAETLRLQVLQQSQTAVLTQANVSLSAVLQLLS